MTYEGPKLTARQAAIALARNYMPLPSEGDIDILTEGIKRVLREDCKVPLGQLL